MTLFDLLPSLKHGLNSHLDGAIWPLGTHVDEKGRLCVGGVAVGDVAAEFGTPTYVVDEEDFRARIRGYRAAIPGAEMIYAGKALLSAAMAGWAAAEGAGVGVCSGDRHQVVLSELNLGGGHAVPSLSGDPELSLRVLATVIDTALRSACADYGYPRPQVVVEPGRGIAARAGVTLYRVIAVKRQPGGRTFVAVDGDLTEDPRLGARGAKYTVALANRHMPTRTVPVTVVGRHCEAGDEIARDVELAADIHPGDLLAVACTGAYHYSVGSSCSLVGRPPLIAVADGRSYELVRRETVADLLARDCGRPGYPNSAPTTAAS